MKVCVGAECVGDYGDSDDSCLDTQQTDDAQCYQLECRELGHANTRRRVEHDSHVRLALTACTTTGGSLLLRTTSPSTITIERFSKWRPSAILDLLGEIGTIRDDRLVVSISLC